MYYNKTNTTVPSKHASRFMANDHNPPHPHPAFALTLQSAPILPSSASEAVEEQLVENGGVDTQSQSHTHPSNAPVSHSDSEAPSSFRPRPHRLPFRLADARTLSWLFRSKANADLNAGRGCDRGLVHG
jgi:hypothetical protein